jgi:succinate dehydrogenase / fumarate reductase flavoprotein subunit
MPVQPTAHYAMGGIPTDADGRVLVDRTTPMPGLYAAGECACVSVHGANRLGTNSLVDLVVFGRRAGKLAVLEHAERELEPLPPDVSKDAADDVARLLSGDGTERTANVRADLQDVMTDYVGVYRTQEGLEKGLAQVRDLRTRYARIHLDDKGRRFNTDLLEAWELGCMLDLAEATAAAALARTESRGAHSRVDYPERDDENWLKHSLAYRTDDGIRLDTKPVTITRFTPKPRVY